MIQYTRVSKGIVILPDPGDIVFVKTNNLMGWLIRIGEWLRFHRDTWNHVAFIYGTEGELVEALITGVAFSHLSKYRENEYLIAHTGDTLLKDFIDFDEACNYLESQIDKPYGFVTFIGTLTRFLTPGHGFWFAGRANICSGLVAQALIRGTFNPILQPVTMSPSELAEALNINTK